MARRELHVVEPPERVLPHSRDAERAVLGAILVSPTAWMDAVPILVANDFYHEAHRHIWGAMKTVAEANEPIDAVTVTNVLRRGLSQSEWGGPAYIAGLTNGVPNALNVEAYARIVREKAQLRRMAEIGDAIQSQACSGTVESAMLASRGIDQLLEASKTTASTIITLSSAVSDFIHDLDRSASSAIPTGLEAVDEIIGGLWQKELSIIAARPSVGKTSMALCIAEYATRANVPTAIITLEMSTSALAGNLVGARAGVSSNSMRRKAVPDHRWDYIQRAVTELSERPLYLVQGAYTLPQVLAQMRLLVERYGVRMVLIDYLQCMEGESGSKYRTQDVAGFSRALARAAQELDVAIVALSQLTRGAESTTDRRPQLHHLRESGNLEQDASMVLLLYRESMHKQTDENRDMAEVIIAKNRQGPIGVARVRFVSHVARFEDL